MDSSYKSNAGMGRTGDVFVYADTNDETTVNALFKDAFKAVMKAADGDPDLSLQIRVTAADGSYSSGPQDLGYKGGETLSDLQKFLREHPDL
ncbi:hypothetical protein ACQHIV_04095 [Kribbella sp. GL6]|uniref:hypothetical protein n=1 Tax=Kribbella sp. GL6 TaxID=3419765 RepID=UPI003D04A744